MITIVTHDLIDDLFENKEIFEYDNHEYTTLIEYLQDEYPNGFDRPNTIHINNKKIKEEDYDIRLKNNDVVVITFHPGVTAVMLGGGIWGAIGALLANVAISTAASFVMNKVFGPDIPKSSVQNEDAPTNGSSVYSLTNSQNSFRVGQKIPVLYGKVKSFPSLIVPPWREFDSNNNQFLYLLMMIGEGEYNVDPVEVFIANSNVSELKADILEYKIINSVDIPDFGDIEAITGEHQIVHTSDEVSDVIISNSVGSFLSARIFFNQSEQKMTFYETGGGYPDLTLLSVGDDITIQGTISNNKVFTIASVDNTNHFITVESGVIAESRDVYGCDDIFGTLGEYTFSIGSTLCGGTKPDINVGDTIGISNQGSTVFVVTAVDIDYDCCSYTKYTYTLDTALIAWLEPETTYTISSRIIPCEYKSSSLYGAFSVNPAGKDLVSRKVYMDFEFPRGLYNMDSAGVISVRSVEVIVTITDQYGVSRDTTLNFSNNNNLPYRITSAVNAKEFDGSVPGKNFKATLKRTTADITNNGQDEVHLTAIKSPLVYDGNKYGKTTLMWAKVKASGFISSQSQFQINAWVTRSDVPNNLNSVITDIYTNTDYGAGQSASDLDLPTTSETFNGAFDSNIPLLDAMRAVARVGKYSLFPNQGGIKMIKDDVKPLRSALFNETNIIKDSFVIEYVFGEDEQYDGYEVSYRDPIDFNPVVETYPTLALNPQKVDLIGCTSQSVALAEATYRYKSDQARRITVRFDTDVQGLLPNLSDRIAVSHNVMDSGEANAVRKRTGEQLQMREKVDPTHDTIIFISDEGVVSDTFAFTIVDGFTINVSGLYSWIHDMTTHDTEATRCSIGTSTKIVNDYIITKISPSGDDKVSIEAVNYDESIYS